MGTRARATTVTPGAVEEVGNLVGDLMGLVHRRSAGGTLALMNEAGLTMAQMVALYILEHLGPQTVSAIASFLNLSPAATSHLVDRLVMSDFVGRTEDPEDRRQKSVAITRKGQALATRVHRERAREFGSALALLSPELQGQFASVLGRVVDGLRAAPENPAHPDLLTRTWTNLQGSRKERTKKTRG
ncbi:MAG: transcriptional regulator, MarR family [Myxococcales bacterium]|nr:transcriptional regulator, MarR family [Myxococcales bacterium]